MIARPIVIASAGCLAVLLAASVAKGHLDQLHQRDRLIGSELRPRSAPAIRSQLLPAQAGRAAQSGLLPSGVKSLLSVNKPLTYGQFIWADREQKTGPIEIWVDLDRQMISVFREKHEIGTAVIIYGAPEMGTPVGRFSILRKIKDYHSRSYDAPMPYSLFLTTDGVALHESPISRRRATHGCIGLPEEFARLVFDAAKTGDPVTIVQ
ncbi:L,D-transpeptidase family protein [Tsuneonella amylolytica]|uniref:L,D-transpeptidase family protein n=1 Tax=Tsuneonella amylolytica TaxID=2338327 RepID=UPI000EA90551|nr:L,D-transpeptidase family protein [Tsuneonella amylolytica]